MKLLVIEDDPKTACAVAEGLRAKGFDVTVAGTGEDGFFLLNSDNFDALILDWMLPGRDGLEVLKTYRACGKSTPILLLTARDSVADRVKGLEFGADDYLVKPFAFAELVARIRALLRRSHPALDSLKREIGNLIVDLGLRRVQRGGREVPLTPREFDLLVFLLKHEGEPVTRQMIAQEVWRESNRATSLNNVIDVHLAHLRRKIDDGKDERLIHTLRGVGFVMKLEKPK